MLSHVDPKSNQPTMVDITQKSVTLRTATAESVVVLPRAIADLFKDGEIQSKKGPVTATAIIAGTMAAKNTSNMIPFCHPLPIEKCKITCELKEGGCLVIECQVSCQHKTGVEMEALVGASVAALTIYDMCKAMSHDIVIKDTRLLAKSGGKSDFVAKENH